MTKHSVTRAQYARSCRPDAQNSAVVNVLKTEESLRRYGFRRAQARSIPPYTTSRVAIDYKRSRARPSVPVCFRLGRLHRRLLYAGTSALVLPSSIVLWPKLHPCRGRRRAIRYHERASGYTPGTRIINKKKTAGMRGIRDRYKIRDRNGFIVSVSTSYTRWLVVDESGPCIDAGKR